MKLQTNASNGIMGMDFILVIYLVITVSFASRAAVLSLPNSLPDWLFHCLPGREILKPSVDSCILHTAFIGLSNQSHIISSLHVRKKKKFQNTTIMELEYLTTSLTIP